MDYSSNPCSKGQPPLFITKPSLKRVVSSPLNIGLGITVLLGILGGLHFPLSRLISCSLNFYCILLSYVLGVWSCCFCPTSNSTLCTASEDCSLRIWDMRGDKSWHSDMVLSGVHRYAIKACCWSPCGNYLAAGSRDHKVQHLYIIYCKDVGKVGISYKMYFKVKLKHHYRD